MVGGQGVPVGHLQEKDQSTGPGLRTSVDEGLDWRARSAHSHSYDNSLAFCLLEGERHDEGGAGLLANGILDKKKDPKWHIFEK